MASGILLAILPFLPQHAVQLRVHELIPLAQMFALAAFVAHAQLHQNAAGRWIVPEVRGEDAMQTKVNESVAQHFTRSLSRVSLAPIGHAQPVAKFGVLVWVLDAEAYAANLTAITAQGGRQPDLAGLLREGEECPCVLLGVWMRKATRSRRHLPRTDQGHQFSDVGLTVRAQFQPRGFERRKRGH